MQKSKTIVFDSVDELTRQASSDILALAERCIAERGCFSIALSGGSTPKQLYQTLAQSSQQVDWSKFQVFFGDERFVPQDDDRSNFKMVQDNLLQQLPIPDSGIFPVPVQLNDPDTCALHYAKTIEAEVKPGNNGIPSFDLVLLGVGEDGHTASLFPNSGTDLTTDQLVINTYHKPTETDRISFSLHLINNAQNIFVLVTGKSKSEIINRIFAKEISSNPQYPIQHVKALESMNWYMDRDAAGE